MKTKTILMVHNYYQIPGGEDTVVANEKQLLEEHGHKVLLYSRNNSDIKGIKKLLAPFTTIFNPKTYRDIRKIIKTQQIDIVHVHNTQNLISPAVYYAAHKCRVPVVQTLHNYRLLCPNGLFYRDGHVCEDCVQGGLRCSIRHSCYRNSKAQTVVCVLSMCIHRMTGIYGKINYIALTEFGRQKLLQHPDLDPARVFIKPNFTFNAKAVLECSNAPTEHGERPLQYVYAGRLEEVKGTRVLFEAWRLMGSRAPRLIVCGTGPLESWCKEFIQEHGLTSIEMRGFVDNAEVKGIVADSTALLLPTLLYETFGMTILEAYSAGTPVICSDYGNTGYIVEEGVTGWKFEVGNSTSLAKAVQRSMGENIRNKVLATYNSTYLPERNYACLVEIYEQILKEGEGA